MPKTFEQLTNLEKKRLGQLCRNLVHSGFKKSFLAINEYTLIYRWFGLKFHLHENGYLRPSEYIQIMQAIYKIYGWGPYDDEEECVWLWIKIKSRDFIAMVRRNYGEVHYIQLVTLLAIYKKDFNLRLNIDEL